MGNYPSQCFPMSSAGKGLLAEIEAFLAGTGAFATTFLTGLATGFLLADFETALDVTFVAPLDAAFGADLLTALLAGFFDGAGLGAGLRAAADLAGAAFFAVLATFFAGFFAATSGCPSIPL